MGKALPTKFQQPLQARRPKSTSTPRSFSIFRFDDADGYRTVYEVPLTHDPLTYWCTSVALCGDMGHVADV